GVDAPMDKVQIQQTGGDQFTPCDCGLDEHLATLPWSYAINDSHFLKTKMPTQQDALNRDALLRRTLTPGASAESPLGNNSPYQDLNNNLRFNAISQPAGIGTLGTHRDQGHASLSMFRGSNEIKFGADYQEVSQETLNVVGTLFR